VTEEMHGWYRDPDVEFPAPVAPEGRYPAEKHQAIRRNYAAMVENVDRWVDRFLDVVAERGEREETVVVFAADHGEMLGDHGDWYKRSPHQASAGVPMVVAGAGVAERGLVETPATVLDLHATFLDYAGCDPAAVDTTMDSQSMRPYLEGGADAGDSPAEGGPREVVFSGFGPWRFAFDGQYKLVRGFDSETDLREFDPWDEAALGDALRERDPVLFDLDSDRHETENVADEYPNAVDRLDGALDTLRSV
jgi:arylsulfatase A-like enzyme